MKMKRSSVFVIFCFVLVLDVRGIAVLSNSVDDDNIEVSAKMDIEDAMKADMIQMDSVPFSLQSSIVVISHAQLMTPAKMLAEEQAKRSGDAVWKITPYSQETDAEITTTKIYLWLEESLLSSSSSSSSNNNDDNNDNNNNILPQPCSKCRQEFLTSPDDLRSSSESFQICSDGIAVVVFGTTLRSITFGVGHLLRNLEMRSSPSLQLDAPFLPFSIWSLGSKPEKPLRGQMISYRAMSNSYDGWNLTLMEQYVRDLATYGTNFIEIVPPEDNSTSPLFPLPPAQMCIELSRIVASYGLGYWVWWTLPTANFTDPEEAQKEVNRSMEFFATLPSLEAVFIPGGDPGDNIPQDVFALMKAMHEPLQKLHPNSSIWVSSQGYNAEAYESFVSLCNKCAEEKCDFLRGVVYGPHTRVDIIQHRKDIAEYLPIRHYPDIGHNTKAEYPWPSWSLKFALTIARENHNPKPVNFHKVFHEYEVHTAGFGAYSDGSADDPNKFLWAGLGWNISHSYATILYDYANYLVLPAESPDLVLGYVQGLELLEANWKPDDAEFPLKTVEFFKRFDCLGERGRKSWRLQHSCYRAYYDAYVALTTRQNEAKVTQAIQILSQSKGLGSIEQISAALTALKQQKHEHNDNNNNDADIAQEFRQAVFVLADYLFNSIRMQTSVPLYFASATGRGASLDTIDTPTTDIVWLSSRLGQILGDHDEKQRIADVMDILSSFSSSYGANIVEGFYDNLGMFGEMPHLVSESKGFDPSFYYTPLWSFEVGYNATSGPLLPTFLLTYAETYYDTPLKLHYPKVNPSVQYQVKVVYTGDSIGSILIKLVAVTPDGSSTILHDFMPKPDRLHPVIVNVPHNVTSQGSFSLVWSVPLGIGGNGRGCQVAQVWVTPN